MLRHQPLKEPGENFFSITGAASHHGVGVMVENNGHILVAFIVAGLINTDVHQPIKAEVWRRIVDGKESVAAVGRELGISENTLYT